MNASEIPGGVVLPGLAPNSGLYSQGEIVVKKLIAISAGLVVLTTSAWATNPPPPPPPNNGGGPTTNIQGQAQGQIQGQHQGQQQTAIGKGGAGGGGGAGGAGGAGGLGGGGGVGNGGNQSQGQTLNNNGAGANSNNYTQAGIPVATSTAPSFAIGQCQWAVSGGAQFFGFGGSAGGAGLYEFCKGMMQADHFRKIGREDMAKLMECNFDNFRAAYRDAGTPCRADVPKDQQAVTPIVQPVGWTPPNSSTPTTMATAGAAFVVPMSRQAQCFDSAGRPVPLGTAGAVRCN